MGFNPEFKGLIFMIFITHNGDISPQTDFVFPYCVF